MGKQRLLVGYLYRNRAVTGLMKKSEEAALSIGLESVAWDVFECLGGQCCIRGSVLWGILTGRRGGIWARRPWTVLRQLLQDRWLECFEAVTIGRQFIAENAQRMVVET